ncbi:PilZ domain-containing protein [Candidatus Electronema sp. PJ]|uniref:PilZ domain-containing protein n=1 Tax=Candidatus Electronema sp. PJ TaxID=3401572 RepID=UPI003AA965A2
MTDTGIRRFTRVNSNHTVRLDFGAQQYDQQLVSNLSLGGMYIKGRFTQQPRDLCILEAEHRLPSGASIKFQAKGSTVRCTEDGLAIQFVSMPHDSLQFLQTALLYQAEDPITIGTEFSQDAISFETEEAV